MRIEKFRRSQFSRVSIAALTGFVCLSPLIAKAGAPELKLTIEGAPETIFAPKRDACDGSDVPDINARAFRNADDGVAMFALHYVNRALRGADLKHLKLDCTVVLGSNFNSDPARYDNQNWIAATWTPDGRRIAALVHHEYHGDQHGKCDVPKAKAGLGCWYNTITSVTSSDSGASFTKTAPAVVASAPFRQDAQQGRHRGFFNPSNIVEFERNFYTFITTTGWSDQAGGACLFRTADPLRAGSWRAWDGQSFSIHYADPYGRTSEAPRPCAVVAPFQAAVGSVVRHEPSGSWIAVMHAWKDEKLFPLSGFYYATSRNLREWSEPRLLLATKTLSDDACGADRLRSYPSIIDVDARDRNFTNTGETPSLYYTDMRVEGCSHTSDRQLMRLQLRVGKPT